MSEPVIEQQVVLPKYNLTAEQEKKLILRTVSCLTKNTSAKI